jgi:hypothetical protein
MNLPSQMHNNEIAQASMPSQGHYRKTKLQTFVQIGNLTNHCITIQNKLQHGLKTIDTS